MASSLKKKTKERLDNGNDKNLCNERQKEYRS